MTNNAPIYLRAIDDTAYVAYFMHAGAKVALFMDTQFNVTVQAVTKTGKLSTKVLGTGRFTAADTGNTNLPELRGFFETKKGARFGIAGYAHSDPIKGDTYFVLKIAEQKPDSGFLAKLVSPQAAQTDVAEPVVTEPEVTEGEAVPF